MQCWRKRNVLIHRRRSNVGHSDVLHDGSKSCVGHCGFSAAKRRQVVSIAGAGALYTTTGAGVPHSAGANTTDMGCAATSLLQTTAVKRVWRPNVSTAVKKVWRRNGKSRGCVLNPPKKKCQSEGGRALTKMGGGWGGTSPPQKCHSEGGWGWPSRMSRTTPGQAQKHKKVRVFFFFGESVAGIIWRMGVLPDRRQLLYRDQIELRWSQQWTWWWCQGANWSNLGRAWATHSHLALWTTCIEKAQLPPPLFAAIAAPSCAPPNVYDVACHDPSHSPVGFGQCSESSDTDHLGGDIRDLCSWREGQPKLKTTSCLGHPPTTSASAQWSCPKDLLRPLSWMTGGSDKNLSSSRSKRRLEIQDLIDGSRGCAGRLVSSMIVSCLITRNYSFTSGQTIRPCGRTSQCGLRASIIVGATLAPAPGHCWSTTTSTHSTDQKLLQRVLEWSTQDLGHSSLVGRGSDLVGNQIE